MSLIPTYELSCDHAGCVARFVAPGGRVGVKRPSSELRELARRAEWSFRIELNPRAAAKSIDLCPLHPEDA